MKKGKRVAIILLILILATGSYWLYDRYVGHAAQALQASGTIEATTVELNAKTAGTIKVMRIKEGDVVSRGQLVAEISRNDIIAQRERDAMTVLKAEAQLADLVFGARDQEIEEARASVNIAQANLEKAVADLARKEALFEVGGISIEEVEHLRTALELEKNRHKAAEARLSLLESGSRPQSVEAARLEVERCRAVLKATEALLEDLKVYSPIDGVVQSCNYEDGEFVQMGASLVTVTDLRNLWIKVFIPTDDLPTVKLGQEVHFTVSGDSRVFEGVVQEIASRGEFTPKTIQTPKERTNVVFGVKIRIKDQGGVLKPGMPADVVFAGE